MDTGALHFSFQIQKILWAYVRVLDEWYGYLRNMVEWFK
jgi:hypothetical protein